LLGGEEFPAPAAQVWKGVAELMANGLSSLHVTERLALGIGGFVGILIPILERVLPARARAWVPSPMGLGLAFVIPFYNTLSIFVGALLAWILMKKTETLAAMYTIPVAAGTIAGESLMGVVIASLDAVGFG
jgi:uncharacterized oligopeptide transporter (OPT) family protein